MEFYGDNEIAAVQMIADRVRETDEYEYEGWSPQEILVPTRKNHHLEHSPNCLNWGQFRVICCQDRRRQIQSAFIII